MLNSSSVEDVDGVDGANCQEIKSWGRHEGSSRDGKEPSLFGFVSVRVLCLLGFCSVRVLVKYVKRGFGFGSVLSKMRVLVWFVRFGLDYIPIYTENAVFVRGDLDL